MLKSDMLWKVGKTLFLIAIFCLTVLYSVSWALSSYAQSQAPQDVKKNTVYSGTCMCVNRLGLTADTKYHCAKGDTSLQPLNCQNGMYCGLDCAAVPQVQPGALVKTPMQNPSSLGATTQASMLLDASSSSALDSSMSGRSKGFSVPSPMDILVVMKDGIKKIIIFRLISIFQAYWLNSQHFPIGKAADNTWIQDLVDSGELSATYKNVLMSFQPQNDVCGTPAQQGFCYISDGKNAEIFVQLLSKEEKTACNGQTTFFYWSSTGDSGKVCNQISF